MSLVYTNSTKYNFNTSIKFLLVTELFQCPPYCFYGILSECSLNILFSIYVSLGQIFENYHFNQVNYKVFYNGAKIYSFIHYKEQ